MTVFFIIKRGRFLQFILAVCLACLVATPNELLAQPKANTVAKIAKQIKYARSDDSVEHLRQAYDLVTRFDPTERAGKIQRLRFSVEIYLLTQSKIETNDRIVAAMPKESMTRPLSNSAIALENGGDRAAIRKQREVEKGAALKTAEVTNLLNLKTELKHLLRSTTYSLSVQISNLFPAGEDGMVELSSTLEKQGFSARSIQSVKEALEKASKK